MQDAHFVILVAWGRRAGGLYAGADAQGAALFAPVAEEDERLSPKTFESMDAAAQIAVALGVPARIIKMTKGPRCST
jgi:hypothetical protein